MIASDTTRALVASLVQLAFADGKVDSMEAAHIQLLAAKAGIDAGEFDRICAQPSYYLTRSPIGLEDKRTFLAHLIAFVSFDLHIADEEQAYCEQKARELGFSAEAVAEVFAAIRSRTLPIEEIRSVLR
ncbi:MAG: TerB family tellurite resistance protein [Flavobacteriales bacterium]|nr:TerB family tellurite resistance protein [Flavobacteriales bacterium]